MFGSHAGEQNDANDPSPELNGQLLFHRYTSYESWNSKLYLYDFAAKSLTCLTDAWPVDHAMNSHFSPDGKRIVFMAVPRGKHQGNAWDVYLWDVSSAKLPTNLTKDNGLRDEDPKFSPDGKTIVFKQDGIVKFMDLRGKNVRALPGQQPGAEYSMPFFTADGKRVVVLQGARDSGDLYALDPRARSRTTPAIAVTPGLFEYYPVTWDENRLLYVRWHSAENRHDQIYRYLWKERASEPLPFCKPTADYSDPWPIDDRWLFLSSTQKGGHGGYDLYLGDSRTTRFVPITVPGINTSAEELGACYRPRPAK